MSFSKRVKGINIDYVMYGILIVFFFFMIFFSSFRDMIKDEALYFHETWLMSEVLKSGQWIGNYAVGLHGFLFKLPLALVFLVTGPSISIVTMFNILLATVVGLVFYNLSKEVLGKKSYALLSTLLLLTTFHFFSSTPTYLREIPSLLAILLFMYAILKGWSKWSLSFIFLLLLDTKEYIFFVFALFYLVWLFINSEKKGVYRVVDVLKRYVLILLPSIIWLILMFCTEIIPINMYVASTIGLISKNFAYLSSHFSLDTATANLLEGGREIPLIQINESWGSIAKWMIGVINVILSYIGKILYPRTFSFLSVPKVVMFPVLFTSILFVKRYIKTREKDIKRYAGLSLLILIWVLVYILRASHGRYLLPIVPAISIVYIYVLYKYKYTSKQLKSMMIGTLIFVLLGFFFETSYVLLKILIEISMYILFLICMTKPKKEYFKHILVLFISSACLGVSILFAYTQGQVYGYVNWGENRQVEEIAKILPKNDKYWCNNSENQMLVSVYTNETYSEPQWKWKLNEIVPRIDDLKVLGEQKSFVFPVKNIDEFKKNIDSYRIKKIVLYESTVDGADFPDQEYLDIFLQQDWMYLEDKYIFKGMNIYIFNVI